MGRERIKRYVGWGRVEWNSYFIVTGGILFVDWSLSRTFHLVLFLSMSSHKSFRKDPYHMLLKPCSDSSNLSLSPSLSSPSLPPPHPLLSHFLTWLIHLLLWSYTYSLEAKWPVELDLGAQKPQIQALPLSILALGLWENHWTFPSRSRQFS